MTAAERARHPVRNGEHNQSDRIVKRDNREQNRRQCPFRLILLDDHHRRRGRGRRSHGAEDNRGRKRNDIREQEMEHDQSDIDHKGRGDRLHRTDHRRLAPRVLQARPAKFTPDRESDEAERDLGDDM